MLIWKLQLWVEDIGKHLFSNPVTVEDIAGFETPDHISVDEAKRSKRWKPWKVGRKWGKPWGSAWFRLQFAVPKTFAGKTVALRLETGGEAAIFENGVPVQGQDDFHTDYRLLERAKGGEKFDFLVEAGVPRPWKAFTQGVLSRAEVCVVNREVWDCYYTLKFLREMVATLPEDSPRHLQILNAADRAVTAFDFENTDEASLKKSAKAALAEVAEVCSHPASPGTPAFHMVGQSHIDVVWLWPIRETIRKCARTFSTVLKYMEEYPEYRFCQSNAQLYAWTKERFPELYERIKVQIKKGRWEVVGGMWVESDANLLSGESFVRQILYGQKFFEEEFGVQPKTVWLPDVFGFAGSIPQIIRKCDMRNFTTQKITWNEVNTFPYRTFNWRGIDGSEALVHFPSPRAQVEPAMMAKGMRQFTQAGHEHDHMCFYGHGDGGGGPDKRMIETIRAGDNVEGFPRMVQGGVDEYFERIEKTVDNLPTWVGELYLEKHRGVYTTHADTKKWNRQCEFLIREAEILSSIAMLDGQPYPETELLDLWHLLLLNQFHDILPGTSITEVHDESAAQFKEVLARGAAVRDGAMKNLIRTVDTRGAGQAVFVFNSLSWSRSSVVETALPKGHKGDVAVFASDGAAMPCEILGKGKNRRVRFIARDVPGIGYAVYHLRAVKAAPESPKLKATKTLLENDFLRVRFDRKGLIRSIFDKVARREIVPEGQRANALVAFEDKPLKNDAWDFWWYYADKAPHTPELESIEVVSEGPIEAAVRIRWRLGKSPIEQVVALGAESRRIDFRTHVDWQEENRLLKASFPTNLNPGSPARATFEIPYGNIERAAHDNTTWEQAQFETNAHRWAELAEGDYGVALLNDCKYGYNIRGSNMWISLLRTARHPDPTADYGEHEFTYSLMPHAGDYRQALVVREGYELNVPLLAYACPSTKGARPPKALLFGVDAPNVILEAIKKAEKSDDLILRVYEAHNSRTQATLTLPGAPKRLTECNLVERDIAKAKATGNAIQFEAKPFEIKSFRVGL